MFVLLIGIMLASWLVSNKLKNKFETYSKLHLQNGMSGAEIAEKMLALAEQIARERGACKLTLEVLQGNVGAIKLYQRIGFANYQLDPAMGQAQFLQKWLPVLSNPT